jgi:hypothetical protein
LQEASSLMLYLEVVDDVEVVVAYLS